MLQTSGALHFALCTKKNLRIQIALICIRQFSSPINFFRANVEEFCSRSCEENFFERITKISVRVRAKKNLRHVGIPWFVRVWHRFLA